MGALIQMIYVGNENYLFLKGFNQKGELVFRSSLMPKMVQHEPIHVDAVKQICYTNLYFFHAGYLSRIQNETI